MLRLATPLVAALACLAGIGAASAAADTTVIGQLSLTPRSQAEFPNSLGPAGAPVFQGDAAANYVLSAPDTGTVTSFSFLSAGVAHGSRFELAVLRPATGSSWTLVALGQPVEVTSATSEDRVNSFSANVPIEAGDRIGLEPVGGEYVPIDVTQAAGDGVRYFVSPLGVGGSENVAGEQDSGQQLPLQATVEFTPSSGSTTSTSTSTSPPVDLTPPTVTGTPEAGHTLSCEPGSWTGSPSFSVTWSQSTSVLVPGAKPPQVKTTTTEVASGSSYVVPDLPPGVSISCTVTASNAATAPGAGPRASSAPVALETVPPVLAPSFSVVYHTKHNQPSISAGVGYGGVNVCHPGVWEHYPTSFSYLWYEEVYSPHGIRGAPPGLRLIHIGQKLTITAPLERHEILCRVTASNSAGRTSADSNRVTVPRLAPKALGAPGIEVLKPAPVTQDPLTARESPLFWGPAANFSAVCHPPKFNRHVIDSVTWEVQFYATSKTGYGVPTAGSFAPEDTFPAETLPGSVFADEGLEVRPDTSPRGPIPPAGYEPLFNGQLPAPSPAYGAWNGEVAVECSVTAHLPGTKLDTVVNTSPLYLLLENGVSGSIGRG